MSTADGLARSSYYGFTYVPFATLNGSGSSANSITENSIDSEFNKPEYFSFTVNSVKISNTPKICSTSVKVSCIESYRGSSDLVLMAAIIENNVDYFSTYGEQAGNGKNMYNHVLRKFISGTDGTTLSISTAGNEEAFNFTYENDETYNNYLNLRIIVFVQDRSIKEILGAYQTNDHPFQEITSVKSITKNSNNFCISNNRIKLSSKKSGYLVINILDLRGKTIYSKETHIKKGQNSIKLKSNNLCKGTYIIHCKGVLNSHKKILID